VARGRQGTLFIVATPIGNLQDITFRAVEILKQVDLIAAEDTRHSKKLLSHYLIHTPLISLHEYNETKIISSIIEQLRLGKNIALISDAGTPLISDPGYKLVVEARAMAIQVTAIPGPTALITALCLSGLPANRFIFEGFLPSRQQQRAQKLRELTYENRTMIFYESPHRLLSTLEAMTQAFGKERPAVLAKELTKTFETIYAGSLESIIAWLREDQKRQLGEFVILIAGREKSATEIDEQTRHTMEILSRELPHKQAVALTARLTGVRKNSIYKLIGNCSS
jgi:16S rRNA (cytidine1402-2'-O)-methyltransferase